MPLGPDKMPPPLRVIRGRLLSKNKHAQWVEWVLRYRGVAFKEESRIGMGECLLCHMVLHETYGVREFGVYLCRTCDPIPAPCAALPKRRITANGRIKSTYHENTASHPKEQMMCLELYVLRFEQGLGVFTDKPRPTK